MTEYPVAVKKTQIEYERRLLFKEFVEKRIHRVPSAQSRFLRVYRAYQNFIIDEGHPGEMMMSEGIFLRKMNELFPKTRDNQSALFIGVAVELRAGARPLADRHIHVPEGFEIDNDD